MLEKIAGTPAGLSMRARGVKIDDLLYLLGRYGSGG
jgi:hypothetical protein